MTTHYKFSSNFTTLEMPVKYVHLRKPFEDDRGNEYRITIHCNYTQAPKEEKLDFLRLLHAVLKESDNFVKPANGAGYLSEALHQKIIYRKSVGGDEIYFMTPSQKTGFSFKSKKTNKVEIAHFPVPVTNFMDEKILHDEIPLIDDSYDTKAKVTMKIKTQLSTGRMFLDLVAVCLTDFKAYVKEKDVTEFTKGETIDNSIDIDLGDEFDSSGYSECGEDDINNSFANCEDDIPF